MSGSPMDPERLARLRRTHTHNSGRLGLGDYYDYGDALDDRDHWEAEAASLRTELLAREQELLASDARAQRYRSRCPVTAEDVEAAEVTLRHAVAWTRVHDMNIHDDLIGFCGPIGTDVFVGLINAQGARRRRPAFDILDEMAKGAAR